MQQFSFYQTLEGNLDKTVCLLTEKCYNNNLKVVIVARDIEMQERINAALWTYSQKQFIPHGSKSDPLHAEQPVYITTEVENPNNATVALLVNPTNVINIIPDQQLASSRGQSEISAAYLVFHRIIIIYDSSDKNADNEINQLNNELQDKKAVIEHYIQDTKGAWVSKNKSLL